MKPFIIYGGTDKERQNYAENVAYENKWNFITLDCKDFKLYSRYYITSNMDNTKTLFFIYDCQKMDADKSNEFLQLVKDSNHIYMLSIPISSDINYDLKKNCLTKNLGDKMSDLMLALKNLMTVADRDSVRLAIENIDPNLLFHVMKKEAWQSPESLQALLDINRHIYKVKPDYIRSLLAYRLPKKAFATNFTTKKVENKMQKSIQDKLAKTYHLNGDESADLYQIVLQTHAEPERTGHLLTQEEKQFLGIVDKPMQATLTSPKPKQSLESFF